MSESGSDLLRAALDYLDAGLSVLPAHLKLKYAAIRKWKPYQSRLPSHSEIGAWLKNGSDAICIIAGEVSGNLEMLDFDLAGEAFEKWCILVKEQSASLPDRLVIETSPSGGFHVVYRSEVPVCGNLKLAQRRESTDGPEPVVIHGKKYVPRKDTDGRWHIILTLIETRGEGGLFLCAPSLGYVVTQGDFRDLPVLEVREREVLLRSAWSLNDYFPEVIESTPTSHGNGMKRPGDDFNERGDIPSLLKKHGWALARPGENEYWRRPGKSKGWSATLKDRVFYVFSSNAYPFEANQAYAPFAVYALLENNGDFAEAARALRVEDYGEKAGTTDIDASTISCSTADEKQPDIIDPGPIPTKLLRIPGFVSEVMDYCLETAPYPNTVMAFCGALALQAFLAGRKVRDPGDNRTNVYLLGLGHSGTGKDWPRKINTKIIHEIGMADSLGEHFASGEGIQDALFGKPCMLFQTDEIDGLLQTINKAKDARHENIMSTLLTMFSASNSVFPMRRKAGKESPGAIDQPCLVIFGTAIPNHYYEALSERMLTNGFFARMIILESARRPEGQDPKLIEIPDRILEIAKWWSEFNPGTGNLEKWHPVPKVVEHISKAVEILAECRREAEAEYSKAEAKNDSVSTTVWSRVNEQARKLALLYAVSENHIKPVIGKGATEWGSLFAVHQAKRMLFMANEHVSENDFDAHQKKIIRIIRKAGGQLERRALSRKTQYLKKGERQEIIANLMDAGIIKQVPLPTRTKTGFAYKLSESVNVKENVND
ncbi:MAG: DUF3987 domain-containing protein [Planctomycetota bacterium]|nr:MAG: DUF3987 domain-containing protein [Planctomycetota bacterium]